MGQTIKCNFNLFQEGRKYTGHHRNYILESAVKTCYSPETRERMQLREMLGYYGHGRRELAGRLALTEMSTIKLPDGSTMLVENIPSNVTTFFEVDKQGNVQHHQELLDTEPGRIVEAMNASKVGGFSWACGGSDGSANGATLISSCVGFDYVKNPGFSANRGYILESADGGATRDMILESICKMGIEDKKAEQYLEYWNASAILENAALQEKLDQAAIYEDALREQVELKAGEVTALSGQLQGLTGTLENRKKIILEGASKSVVVIPEHILESLISMADEKDFQNIISFYESASRINLKGLPIGEHQKITIKQVPGSQDPEYGTAAAGFSFEESGLNFR